MKSLLKIILLPFNIIVYILKGILWVILLIPLAIFNALAAPSARR